jgi:hypothetical protein
MYNLIDAILSSPFYTVVAIVFIVFLFFFLIKKVFKLVVYCVVLFACFLAYVHFTGGNVKSVIEKTKIKTEKTFKED